MFSNKRTKNRASPNLLVAKYNKPKYEVLKVAVYREMKAKGELEHIFLTFLLHTGDGIKPPEINRFFS